MTIFEIVTVAALILGPILAIVIANYMEAKRTTHNRRMDIFRTLMRTRRNRLTQDHVSALNLVEIEFRKDKDVIDAWRGYFKHLGTEQPRRTDETFSQELSFEQNQAREDRFQFRVAREREKLLAALLHNMAQELNYDVEALDIFEGGYSPQGWAEIEFQQETIRRHLIDLLLGRIALPVVNLNPESKSEDVGLREEDKTK